MFEIDRMKRLYGNKIRIKTGLEFGIQKHTIPDFQRLFERYAFDFIILSIHQVENQGFWTQDFQRGRSQKEYQHAIMRKCLRLSGTIKITVF